MLKLLTLISIFVLSLASCTNKLAKEFPKDSVVYVKMKDGSTEKFYVYGHSIFWVEVTSSTTDVENAVIGTVRPKALQKEAAVSNPENTDSSASPVAN